MVLKRTAVIGSMLGLIAVVLMNGPALAFNSPFTVTPGNVPGVTPTLGFGDPFVAEAISFTYNTSISQGKGDGKIPPTSTFSEDGVVQFLGFETIQKDIPRIYAPITAGESCLNFGKETSKLLGPCSYKMFMKFSTTGTVTTISPTGSLASGLIGTLMTFTGDIIVDPAQDDTKTVDTLTDPGTADDVIVATVVGFVTGGFHVFGVGGPTAPNGDFDVVLKINPVASPAPKAGQFFFPSWQSPMLLDLNGNNDVVSIPVANPFTGFPPPRKGSITGHGDLTVQPITTVPEPMTLLLLGSGLAALGIVQRLKKTV